MNEIPNCDGLPAEYQEAQTLARRATDLSVDSPQSAEHAQAFFARLTKCLRACEARLKALREPLNRESKRLGEEAEPFLRALREARASLEGRVLTYQRKVEEERAREQAKLTAAYERRVENAEMKAAKKGAPVPLVVPPPILAPLPATTKTDEGAISKRHIRDWRIQQPDGTFIFPGDAEALTAERAAVLGIPLKFFVLDVTAIGKVIRAGGDIPGIQAYEREQLTVRG